MSVVDAVEIVGAVAILLAFAGAQAHRLDVSAWSYLMLNAAGSAVLAVIAATERSWGFLLLEGVWAIVSIIGLIGKARGRGAPAAH